MGVSDEVFVQMGKSYTQALAQSMGTTKMQLINSLFENTYQNIFNAPRLIMPRRGRYQVWQGMDLVADRIKHRKEALALIKLLKGNAENE